MTAYADSATSQLVMLEACPLLGIDEDRASHFEFPSGAHRCYAGAAAEIALDHQARYCLGAIYRSCPRFTTTPALVPQAPTRSYRGALTLLALPPVVAVIAVTLALAQFGGLNGASPDKNGIAGGLPSPTVTPMVTAAPSTAAPATQAATPSPGTSASLPVATTPPVTATPAPPSPTPTATPLPTPRPTKKPPLPTPRPTKKPPDRFIYVVEQHDTLSSIARRFGVTISDIMEANNLENPDLIYNGQQLIIPRL